MTTEKVVSELTDSIYGAVLDSDRWPSALHKLADAVGTAQIAMSSFDWRAKVFTTIAPRIDPYQLSAYREYWAFHEPIVPRAALRPTGKIYALDELMARDEFANSPVYNEWWQPVGCGLAAMGANLVAHDQFTALVCVFNAPGKVALASEQIRVFEFAVPHLIRAVKISRQLANLEIKHLASTEHLEEMQTGVIIVDAAGRVVIANSAAKAMLDAHDGIYLDNGRLAIAGYANAMQKFVASCKQASRPVSWPGGEYLVAREFPRSPFRIQVAPLRHTERLEDVPWLEFGSPVAIVMISDTDADRQQQMDLRRRFGLTPSEVVFATEILKGDGRKAAAQRCGITDATAKSHLASIFEKTETHRQAELIRLLIDTAKTKSAGS
jgi:DNA-binding CsgD family transcriptional regulator